jgi:hypothetical protein
VYFTPPDFFFFSFFTEDASITTSLFRMCPWEKEETFASKCFFYVAATNEVWDDTFITLPLIKSASFSSFGCCLEHNQICFISLGLNL